MWLQHPQLGGFSVVLADDLVTGRPDPDTVMIRARSETHLDLLRRTVPALAQYDAIESGPSLDYPWRLVCPRTIFADAMRELALGLDYRNVKGEAHRNAAQLGHGFVDALHRVHGALARVKE